MIDPIESVETDSVETDSVETDVPAQARQTVSVPARFSVVQSVYYFPASGSGQAEQFDSRFSSWVTQDEQAYIRIVQYDDQQWVALDHGWIKPDRCSCMVIEHLGKELVNPTSLEELDIDTLEIAVRVEADPAKRTMHSPKSQTIPILYVRPGTSLRVAPSDVSRFVVKCRQGSARCKLIFLPD
jgi:hypothetical protein